MGATEKPLPKYRKPPVVEVAVSVYFKSLDGLKTAHYGRFWERTDKDYPKTEDQPPLIELSARTEKRTFLNRGRSRWVSQHHRRGRVAGQDIDGNRLSVIAAGVPWANYSARDG